MHASDHQTSAYPATKEDTLMEDSLPYSALNSLKGAMVAAALEIAKNIEEKLEPIEKLETINQQLNDHHESLRAAFASDESGLMKADFYAKVFKGISDKMLKETLLSKPTYLPQILKFFRNVLVNYFPYDVEDEHLAEVVHSIFNLDAHLYSQALPENQKKVSIQWKNDLDGRVQHGNNNQGDNLESLEQQRLIAEHQWRASLQVDSRLEAVKTRHVQQYQISGWARGHIQRYLNDDPDTFLVTFDNEPSSSDQIINRYGPQLAPEGTFTDDIQWREDLKVGDEIDCLDSEGVWYRSTTLETREAEHDGIPFKQIHVGFRVYDDEEGHKVDDDGRKFVGWSNRYDEWRSLACVSVQRLKTMVKHYKVAGRNFMTYDQMIEDLRDVIQNTKERKIWTIYRHGFFANLRCIADYLNEFGMRGGFERILSFLQVHKDNRKVSLKHIQYLLDFLSKGQPLWHRQFACYFVPAFKENFEKLLLYTNQANTGPLQLNFAKETLNSIQKSYQSILKRYYTIDTYGNILSELQFEIGFSLLKSDKLEKRISGIKEIIEQIKNSKFQMKKTISTQDIIQKLKAENFCEKIFGENYHIQLIQRSTEILRFLINERQLGQQEIDYIWSATQRDQQTKMEIYKIIQDTAILYKGEEIEHFMTKFMSVPPDEFVEKEIECAYELTRFSYKQNSYSQKAAELFWNIATRKKPYKKQIVELASEKFNDLIRNWDKEQKGEFVYLCIENIKDHKATLQSIKILIKLLDQVPQYKQGNNQTIYELSNALIDDFHLIDLIVSDLIQYLKQANDLWYKGVLTPENIETTEVFDLPYTHRANIYFRLNLIRQLLSYSHRQLQQDHLDLLWEEMTQTSQILPDTDSFFMWLKYLLSDQNKLTPEIMRHFFSHKICKEGVSFKQIKKYGFECIQSMFLQINELQDKIVLNNPQTLSHNTTNNQIGMHSSMNMSGINSSSYQAPTNLDFKILVPPNQLEGINALWKLLEEVDKKNMDLISVIVLLITKVYLNLSSVIEEQIHVIGEQFTQECLTRLSHVINDQDGGAALDKESFQDKAQFAKNLAIMMKSFFEDSERNGTGGLRPHLAIERGDFIQRVVIQNNVTSQKICPKYIEVSTYSNMTLWELKKVIALKTKVSPLKLQLNRQDTKKKVLTDNDNIKLLKDLKFESYEQIIAQKKPMTFINKVSLVNRKQELVPEAKRIFESWFDTFSTDEGFMTHDTCVDFIKNSTNDPNVTTGDQRVTRLFTEYDKDKDGKLSREDFLEFYRDRAVQKPDLVWSNLSAHQFGNDLKHLSYGLYDDDDPAELKDKTHLARYKISSNEDQFELLFDMMEKGYDDIWNTIICQLRTNPKMYADLLTLNGVAQLSQERSHKLLYSLQIMEYFLTEYQVKRSCELKCYYYTEAAASVQQEYPPLPNESNSAPQSGYNGGAIPLPAAQARVNHNIPDAPPIHMGPLPPPSMAGMAGNNGNKGKDNKIYEVLDAFPGSVIHEDLNTELFSNDELTPYFQGEVINSKYLREQWVPTFLQNGGFQLLIQMLTQAMQRQTQKAKEDILSAQVDKECVNSLLRIMKIILMSSFCANSPNLELKEQMQRRMSNIVEEEIDLFDEKKNSDAAVVEPAAAVDNQIAGFSEQQSKILSEQEQTTKEYEPLIHLLIGDLGQAILGSLDFQAYQDLILRIVQLVLNKEKEIKVDDRAIVDQSLQLWISCIVFKPSLLELIYENEAAASDLENGRLPSQVSSISRVLIEKGLLAQNYAIRGQFKDSLLFICKQVTNESIIKHLPQLYFLNALINNLDLTLNRSKDAKQYFELLKALFALHFEQRKANHPMGNQDDSDLQTTNLFKYISTRLTAYVSTEKKGQYTEDYNLSGLIDILTLLMNNHQAGEAFSENVYEALIVEIIETLLFTFDMPPIETHITKEVDLQKLEKAYLNKCQSTDSRQAAYNLLITIVKECPQHLGTIMSKYWYALLYKVKKPKKQGYAPKSEGRSYHGYCGIKNLGCICYMNSMIQQFFHIPTFRYCALAADDREAENMKDFEGDAVDDNMLHQLMKFMGFLELSERQDYNPREFCFSFKDSGGQPTNVRIQQDAQEFLNVAFDRIESQLAKTSQKYLLQNVFGGKTCSMMICKSCGNLRQKFEDFFNLSVEVKNQKTLYDGLKKFISGEIINDFQCEACGQRVDVMKKTVIQKLPNTLIVHLQRIVFDFETMQNSKLNSRVEFPNVLNLKPFMLAEALKEEKEVMKAARKEKKKQEGSHKMESSSSERQEKMEDEKDEESQMTRNQSPDKQQTDTPSSDDEDEDTAMEQDDADENYEYKLVGVVVHMGTADAGHYISYININRGTKPEESPEWLKTESDKWLEFNDSQVKDYKFKDLEEDCFGGIHSSLSTGVHVGVGGGANDFKNDYSRNAYMLIYEKRRKEQIKLVIPESLLLPSQRDQLAQYQQALDCDGTTIPRGSVSLPLSNGSQFQPPHLLFICPEVGTKLLQDRDILYDDESKEHYVLADFNGIQKFVPNSVYKQVHEDNSLFMCERHIFHNSFFSCTKQMLELVISKVPELLLLEDYSSKLYDFMERMIFDLISMTSENKQLGQLTQLLINMLKQNDERTLSFIKKRILTMPGEGNEKPKETSEKKGALSEKSFFEMLISNMEKDVRDMAQALLTFAVNRLFELNDVAQLDQIMDTVFAMMPEELSKNWLKIHQYLTFLFDVTKSGRPQLEYMVRVGLVTKLIDFYLENDSPKAAAGVGVPRRNQMGSNYANPPFESLIMTLCYIAQHQTVFPANTKMSQQEYAGQVHHFLEEKGPSPIFLKQADNYSLILNTEDIEMLFLKQFYAKTLKYGYVTMNLGYLLAHISYENYEFSFKIAKKLLIGINKCNGDDIRPHLEALEPFLYLQDSLSRHRLEWILGVPVIKIERGIHYNSNNMVAGGGPASTSLNLPRVGVQVVSNMNDDIYEYRSTLFKSSTGIKESLLQILFQHRKRWALYTLQCIQSLFKVALFDKDRKIFNYMKTLEPPTYSYGRYIDWIKPYLEDTIQSNMRTQHMHSSKMELQMAMQLFSQLGALLNPVVNAPPPKGDQDKKADQVIEEVKETQDVPEQAQINYLHHDASDGGPEQYLIYRATGEVSRDMRTYQAENITVQVTELQAMISESKPTAHGNLILANNNNGSSFQLQPQQMNGGSSNGRNQGRGNQASQRKQNKDKKRGGGNRGGKGKKSVVCKEQPQTQSIYEGYYPAEDNEMGDNASTEGVQADQDNTMAVDEEGGTLPQDVREGEGIQGDVGGACEDGEYEEEEIEEYDENTHDPGSRQEQFQDEEQRSNNNNIMDFQQDRDHDQDQDHPNQGIVPPTVAAHKDDDYWQANVSAVLIFTVTNHHPVKSLKVVFTFKDESKEGETLNFKLPVTPVVVQVHSNRDKEVIAFTKLRPFDDWGQYSFTARVDVPADKNQNRSFFPHGPSADYAMDTTPASNVSMNQPDLNQKECPTCTFYNAPFLSICEMCATQLPP